MINFKKIGVLGLSALATFAFVSSVKADTLDDDYAKISTNGKFIAHAVKTNDCYSNEMLISSAMMKEFDYNYQDYYIEPLYCENNPDPDKDGYYTVSVALFHITDWTNREHPVILADTRNIKVKFESDVDEKIVSTVNTIASTIDGNYYRVDDMGYIGFINNIPKGFNETDFIGLALPYSNELFKLIGNKNIFTVSDVRMGDEAKWTQTGAGVVTLTYNGIPIASTNSGAEVYNILYVPDDTEETDEAYINAALKRINEYLGENNGITITRKTGISDAISYVLLPDDYTWKLPEWKYMDEDVLNDFYNGMNGKLDSIYEITTSNGNKFYTLIEKNSSKMTSPKLNVSDINTNVSVKTDDGGIPLDTLLTVAYVTDGSNYDKIKEKIKGEFSAVNIDLHTTITRENIKETKNGKFIVSIPVAENLKGKTLTVYYINSKEELEEHKVTVDDIGNASFETDHFSTYILAEPQTETTTESTAVATSNNPTTGDNIFVDMIVLALSAGAIILLNRKFFFSK